MKTLVALAAGLLIAAAGPDDAAKKEPAKFQGTWTVTSAEKDGQEIGADTLADLKLIVEGNKRTLKKGDHRGAVQGQDPAWHLRV